MTFFEQWKKNVKAFGGRKALVDRDGTRSMTYCEFDLLCRKAAKKLEDRKLKKGTPVIVNMGRQAEYMAAYFAIMMAGGVTVPLIPEYPEARVNFIKKDCGADYVIGEDFFADIDAYEPITEDYPEPEENDPVLIVYTSGSTGKPKGIVYTGRSFNAGALRELELFELDEPLIMASSAPLSFIAVLLEYIKPFMVGGTTHMLSDRVRKDVSLIEAYYAEHEISMGFISPQMLRLYQNRDVCLKRILTGSERLRNVYSDSYEILNTYGSSEATPFVCAFKVDKKYDNTPIGTPAEDIELHLLDEAGHEVPDGEEGEICLTGYLAEKYLNLPEKSAEVFQKLEDGRIFYHTGDIGKRLPDGNLIFVNRKDWMVKINGQRVEPGELENLIAAMEGIRNAAVKAFSDRNDQNYLAAYYEADEECEDRIRTLLSERLPEYMLPRFYKRLDRLPKNVNGKLDRTALLPPSAEDYREKYAAPETELEKKICEAFSAVLQCGAIGRLDDFCRLGGDSIGAVRLSAALEAEGCTPQTVIRTRTPKALAEALNGMPEENAWTFDPGRKIYPLSSAERAMFIEQKLHPESIEYNLNITLTVRGTDVESLKNALGKVMGMHEAFRSAYTQQGDKPVRILTDEIPDITVMEARTAEEAGKAIENDNMPFDLEKIPVRVRLYPTTEGTILAQICMHHIMMDGHGAGIFFREVSEILAGREIQPSGYDLSYSCEHSGREAEEHLSYFKEIYSDGLPSGEIPTKEKRPEVHPTADRILQYTIDSYQKERLTECAKVLHATLYELVFAAAAMVTGQYSACEDIVLGVPKDMRGGRTSRTVGMFVNMLPVRIRPEGNKKIAEYVGEVSGNVRQALIHSDCSFEQLVNALCREKDPSRHPLYDVSVNMIDAPQSFCENGVETEYRVQMQMLTEDFQILFENREDGMEMTVQYSADLFEDQFAENYAEQILTVLSRMVKDPEQTLSEALQLPEKQLQVLDIFNHTEREYCRDTIVDQFRAAAKHCPDAAAVIFGEKIYTYGELDSLTDRLALKLRKLGLGREKVAAILIPRCEMMAIASLAVLKAGGAYLPLDPSYPDERLNLMVKDSDAMLMISTGELQGRIHADFTSARLLAEQKDFYGPETVTDEERAELLTAAPKAEDLFILLYTSGSTGTPKGVMLEHRNLSAFVAWLRRREELGPDCRVAAYASFGFDACMLDLWPTLTAGAGLYIVPEEVRLDLPAMHGLFEKWGITHAFMTTQIARQFTDTGKLPSLRWLGTGGEKLASMDPPEYTLLNLYGPTECTVCVTNFALEGRCRDIPIGKALDNCRLYIVDTRGHRAPPGCCGELWIAGPQVSRGYLNRPEKTAAAYGENPFSDDPAYARIYRTGDIVCYLPDGNIRYIGRRDGQVKVRGFRIELSEVEEVIRRFPGVKDAVAVACDEPAGGKFVAAYTVCEGTLDVDALNAFIRTEKPAYMVPAVTMQIDAIPYNQNQKVNRRALPKPELPKKEKKRYAAPLNFLEEKLASMTEQILKIRPDDVTEDLSDLGLTSISAIRLAQMVWKEYGISLEAGKLVSGGTLQAIENAILANWMNSSMEETPEPRMEEGLPASGKKTRLSFEQQGVYADCQQDPHSTRYNMPFCLCIPGDVSPETLKEALLKVIRAHESLRSRFASDENNDVIMELDPDYVPDIPVRIMDTAELETYKKQFVRPFRLDQVPARYEIVKADRLYLLMDIHHLLADGSSIDLIEEQLCRALDGKELWPETCSYFDYAREQKLLPEDDEFFAQEMSQAEEASRLIPDVFEEGRPCTEGSVSAPVSLKMISALACRYKVTPAAVGLAALQLAVSRYLAEPQTAIATISGGRSNLTISDTVGMFVNTLALTAKIDEDENVSDYIRKTADNFMAVLAHEHYPFARLAARFDFHPQISYAWQVGVLKAHSTAGGELTAEGMEADTAKLPVSVFIEEKDGDGVVRAAYDESLYTAQMMQGFADSIAHVLEEFGAQEKCSGISLTGEKEWQTLDRFNRPFDLSFNREDTAVSRFRFQAKAHPEKTAAVYQEKAYTYQQLDALTDRLAAVIYDKVSQITGRKSLAECVVAILSGRNENAFILPLAVLKTGCAYEPLDPGYPKERLNFMVHDAGVCLLLAQDDMTGLVDEYEGEILTFSRLYDAPELRLPELRIAPEDLFVLLYTSGSTGTPKGVQIEHRNLVSYAHGTALEGFYTGDSVVAGYASFGFDVNMADTFCTLLNGGTLHLIPEDLRMNLDALARYFDDRGITSILMTTQVGVQFLQNYPRLKTLRTLTMGGEKLPAVHPEELSYTIINGYGPTENCCGVSLFPIRAWEPNIPIGKPMKTIHGYILDRTGHRLPAGAAGEYVLSGPQVSRGYLNRPDKTAEAYARCPFNEFRMYHTGDIVRYRQNGDVEFVGRKDGQVKIRGFRIETKEVETVIRDFPGIRDVTVQAYDYESGGKYLTAFVVHDGTLKTEELTAFIKARKPAYMVPAVIMQLDQIPLTVNMKVDKKALPRPQAQKAAYTAPAGKTEEDFCAILGDVLGIEKVSALDDFFELGGSSIAAMKVVLAANKAGYAIVYQDVFDHPVPRDMAEYLNQSRQKEDRKLPAEPVTRAPGQSFYGPGTTEIGPDGYDYSAVNELLRRNTLDAYRNGEKQELGSVFLLGATGYLGTHVLWYLLNATDCPITCLLRAGKDADAGQRLSNTLDYYFGRARKHFDGRIRIYEGDVTDEKALEQVKDTGMTVINCAASVKHFSKGNEIEKMNVGSVINLIAWCGTHASRLVHVSTESIMGRAAGGVPAKEFKFTENVLYVGQEVETNQYMRSKFLAERAVYEAILNEGLNARVVRVGNLAPRQDGQFQVNYATNSFMKGLAAYQELGMMPYRAMDGIVEFSPVEEVARAICLLSQAPRECVCFMASNNHLVHYGDILLSLADEKHPIRMAEDTAFDEALKAALDDPARAQRASQLIAYAHSDSSPESHELGPESIDISLTLQVLYRLGFVWPVTGDAYVRAFADRLRRLKFFD